MAQEPEHNKAVMEWHYLWRIGLMALGCLFFAGWSLYDGLVKYPKQRRVATHFIQLQEQDRLDEWPAYAEAEGWPVEPPPGQPKSDWSLNAQYIQAAITMPLGLYFGLSFLQRRGRWIGMEEDGLVTSWGVRVPFDAVSQIDKRRWEKKGIAVVRYHDPQRGKPAVLILDDWQYSRKPTVQMVQAVETRLSDEQIIGGRREGAADPSEDAVTPNPAEEASPDSDSSSHTSTSN